MRVAPGASPAEVARVVAWNIRSELVCCRAYEEYEGRPEEVEELGHGLCFWGEAAARVAESCIEPENSS